MIDSEYLAQRFASKPCAVAAVDKLFRVVFYLQRKIQRDYLQPQVSYENIN